MIDCCRVRFFVLVLFAGSFVPPLLRAADAPTSPPPTVADGAKLVSVYSDERFFEGPAWDPQTKKLYFTAFGETNGKKNEQILRLDGPGKVAVWLDQTEGVNGMYLANDGRLIGAQAYGHRVVSYAIGPTGPADTVVLLHDTKLHQPNDIAQSPTGDLYFTDPDFAKGQTSGVYLLNTKGELKKVVSDMQVTNGVKVSNDGRTLYVADDGPKNWRAYPILADGTVGPGKVFFDPPVAREKRVDPDGMSIDEHGNLYLSGSGGVWVVDRFGEGLGFIPIPEFCSNVTFGGEDGKTLYLTCSKQVYSLAMKVRGGQFVRKNKEPQPKLVPVKSTASAPSDIEFRENVEFGTGGGKTLTLHLAKPAGGGKKRPGIVYIHGGGWAAGNKDGLKDRIREAARLGYVAVSVGYRFAPQDPFPAQVEDVKCAVRWMRAHANELELDADHIGAIGFSAGAHLSMMLGVMDSSDGLEGNGGWPEQSSKVQAVVAYFGPVDLLQEYPEASKGIVKNFIGGSKEKAEAYRRASPITYVNAGDAPMLLYQGTDDALVPYEQAYLMAKALTAVKVPGRVELLLGAKHGWAGKEIERTLRDGYDFFASHLKK